jgi:hypothetical protein
MLAQIGRGRVKSESELVADRFDDGPDANSVDGTGDVVPRLAALPVVGVERDKHQQTATPCDGDGDGTANRFDYTDANPVVDGVLEKSREPHFRDCLT